MTDAELRERLTANLIAFKRLQADRGVMLRATWPGVDAFALTERPATRFFQQVYFTDAGALEAALPAVEDFFLSRGIPGWRVSVPEEDARAQEVLAATGYRPDERVPSLGLALEDVPVTPPGLPLEVSTTLADMVTLNAAAYGDMWAGLLDSWNRGPPPPVYTLVAKEGGRPLSCGFTLDLGDTAGVYMVATAAEARGRGLAVEVMRGLLEAARARGLAASILQSTRAGLGVYQRVGYRVVGHRVDWNSRRAG